MFYTNNDDDDDDEANIVVCGASGVPPFTQSGGWDKENWHPDPRCTWLRQRKRSNVVRYDFVTLRISWREGQLSMRRLVTHKPI